VKSHQNKDTSYADLPPDVKLNVLADQNADSVHTKQPFRTGLFPAWVPGMLMALFKKGLIKSRSTYRPTSSVLLPILLLCMHTSSEGPRKAPTGLHCGTKQFLTLSPGNHYMRCSKK
jgi:hypothetical protein